MGESLRKARLDKGLSVQQVADAIRISPAYLEALEQDRLDPFPAVVYARGFLKSYASYLGLAPEPLLEEFEALCDPDELTSESSRRRYPRNNRSPAVAATISRRYAGASASGFFPTDYAQQRRGRSRKAGLNLPFILVAVLMLILWMAYSHGMMSRFLGAHPNTSAKSSHGATHPNRAPALKPPPPPPAGHISLGLRATGYVHCMVTVDGSKKPIFNGEWMPGEHATFVGQRHIALFADRGNNVVAAFNGKDLGPLSTERHQVWLTFPLQPKPAVANPTGAPSTRVGPHPRPGPSGTTWAARGPGPNGPTSPQTANAAVDADASTRLSTL
ncbi:MAG: helix-turn-helix domain-containing protein [Armatimonadota bacterium]|nr:helix-turn-helix domain-containing protein [Armatimonadota bacterium]